MTGYFDLQIICELPGIPGITRKYPELPENKKDTQKYPIVYFNTPTWPELDPLPSIFSNTRPDPILKNPTRWALHPSPELPPPYLLLEDDLSIDPHQRWWGSHQWPFAEPCPLDFTMKNLPWDKEGLATPLSSCSSLTSSTWLVQQGLLPTTSKKSPEDLTSWLLEILQGLSTSPMVTLPLWPGLAKVQRKRLILYQFICRSRS